jgi:hypothetical protein
MESIIKQYQFNLSYATALVADLTEEQMTIQPVKGLENHPAFTIGHLISGCAVLIEDLGGQFEMPSGWKELFLRKGPGDPRFPETDVKLYPTKAQLLSELEQQHAVVEQLLRQLTTEQLNQPFQWRFSDYMPTLRDLITFMCVNHESMHLGQLAAWRRAMDLPPVLGNL